MAAGDGLLVRIKPRGNRLSIAQATGIAGLAGRHGNGALTLTARGNIQLRGIGEAELPAVTEALDDLGLLDPSAEGEAVRNVLSNPLAGVDPEAAIDGGPVATALEQRLATDPALWRLPAKFAWSVDGGGRIGLPDGGSDIRFTAVRHAGATALAVTLDGGGAQALCGVDAVADVAARLAEAFLALCDEAALEPHRMRDLVAVRGAGEVLRRAGLSVEQDDRLRSAAAPPLSVGPHRLGAASAVVAAPAFGLLDAVTLRAAASHAAAAGATDLRLTPWRSLLVAGLEHAAADLLGAGLAAMGLILDPADPRLGVAACVGQPACHRATTSVPADAARLAAALPRTGATRLHVSGCAKGCAHAGPAAITLVGRDGRYDLVIAGRAGDAPVAVGLLPDAVFATVSALREAGP